MASPIESLVQHVESLELLFSESEQALASCTPGHLQEKMSKLRAQRWSMWRGVVSHSRDIVEQSFSSSPAPSVPADHSVGDAGRPQDERIETLSRVQKYLVKEISCRRGRIQQLAQLGTPQAAAEVQRLTSQCSLLTHDVGNLSYELHVLSAGRTASRPLHPPSVTPPPPPINVTSFSPIPPPLDCSALPQPPTPPVSRRLDAELDAEVAPSPRSPITSTTLSSDQKTLCKGLWELQDRIDARRSSAAPPSSSSLLPPPALPNTGLLIVASDEPCSPIEEFPSHLSSEARDSSPSTSDRDGVQMPSRAVNRSSISISSSSSSSDSDDFESLPITKKIMAGRRVVSSPTSSYTSCTSTSAAPRSHCDVSASQQQQQQQQPCTPPDSGMRSLTPVGSPRKPSNPHLQSEASVLFESSPIRALGNFTPPRFQAFAMHKQQQHHAEQQQQQLTPQQSRRIATSLTSPAFFSPPLSRAALAPPPASPPAPPPPQSLADAVARLARQPHWQSVLAAAAARPSSSPAPSKSARED